MNPKAHLLTILLSSLLVYSGFSKAGNEKLHSHTDIVQAVQQFLQNHQAIADYKDRDIQVGHLDPRLSLTQCSEPLKTYLAPGARTLGKTTVGVRCQSPKPWALYVPAQVNLYQEVYQTADNLAKGHIIRESDISLIKQNISRLNRGYFTEKQQLVGKQTKRRLTLGKIINPYQVKAPLLIKRGEQVELIAKTGLYAVRMSGKAMMDGARGDRIRVKNLSSQRIIEGTVTQAGQVTVLN